MRFTVETQLQDITQTIQLAIAPVFLLSAIGATLAVLSTQGADPNAPAAPGKTFRASAALAALCPGRPAGLAAPWVDLARAAAVR